MDNAKKELIKYYVIQITIIILLLFAFGFWLQPFIVNQSQVGIEQYTITGLEIAFGFSKEIPIPSPAHISVSVEYNKSIFVLIGYISYCIVLLTQIVLFILRCTNKIKIKVFDIISLICAGLTFISTIACFFSSQFFIIANNLPGNVFAYNGSITTGVLFVAILFAIILNSIDLFINKQ